MKSTDTEALKGKCITMCPTNERILRIRERMVHPLECKLDIAGGLTKFPDHQRMVKEFNRSAAGHVITANEVRPLPVLEKTVAYLLSDVCPCKNISWKDKYEFVADRLRAIRQDITVQDLSGFAIAKLYHYIARFYLFAAYNMCEYEEAQYDSYQNMKQLNEVISIVMNIYKTNSYRFGDSILDDRISMNPTFRPESGEFEEQMTTVEDMFTNFDLNTNLNASLRGEDLVDMQFNQSVLIDDYKYYRIEEIVAMNLLVNLGNNDAIRDAFDLPKSLRRGSLLAPVLSACLWWRHGNFLPLRRLIANIPPILCCALHMNFNQVQRQTLGTFSVSHDKTNISDISEFLCKNLLFSSRQLTDTCSYYGLDSSPDESKFKKISFKWDVTPMKMAKSDWLNQKLCESSPSALLLH